MRDARAVAVGAIRGGQLQNAAGAHGAEADSGSLEALRHLVDGSLGEALGQRYVEATFGPDGKARMLKMVGALERVAGRGHSEPFLDVGRDQEAGEGQAGGDSQQDGYPDVYRDYSSVTIKRDDLLGNVQRANEFESKRDIAKIDKPLDRKEWGMTPPEVNAYYSGSYNEIVFPAGILQPPFFDKTMDDAVNFGGIGLVIGHELTHGFDDQGRKMDATGNLRDWWTEQDGKEFEKRVSCVADEYSGFVAVDNMKLNGRLTLGENTADNGGARIALAALERLISEDKTGKEGQSIDGFTPEQRFFLGFGRVWCEKQRPEYLRMQVSTIRIRRGNIAWMVWCRICRNFRRRGTAKRGSRWWRRTLATFGEV